MTDNLASVVKTAVASNSHFGAPRTEDSFRSTALPVSCTDVTCCCLLTLCILGAALCSAFGYLYGDARTLIYGTDSAGRFCGDGIFKDQPFLFFFDILQCRRAASDIAAGCPTPKVCLSRCPKTFFTYQMSDESVSINSTRNISETEVRSKMICKFGVHPLTSKKSIKELVWAEQCAAYYVPSDEVDGHCIPLVFKNMSENQQTITTDDVPVVTAFGEEVTEGKLTEGIRYLQEFYALDDYVVFVFRNLWGTWKYMLAMMTAVMGVSMAWILLLQIIIQPLIWIAILTFVILCAYCAYYSLNQYNEIESNTERSYVAYNQQYQLAKFTWLAIGYTLSTAVILFLFLHIFILRKIRAACDLISQACRMISHVRLVLIWPLVPFAMQMSLFAYYLSTAVYLSGVAEKVFYKGNYTNITEVVQNKDYGALLYRMRCKPDSETVGELCNFVRNDRSIVMHFQQAYMLVIFFWLLNFTVSLGQMTLASVFIERYWTHEKPRHPARLVFTAMWRSVRYHLGTLALGSAIVSLAQLVRSLLEYVDRKLRRGNSTLAMFLVRHLVGCVWCVETVLKNINRNTYIMVAMYGTNFKWSSRAAFEIIMRNIKRIAVVDKITDFLMIVCKLMISTSAGIGAHYWFTNGRHETHNHLLEGNHAVVPIMMVVVCSLSVVNIFFNVFDIAIDTVFLCFLEDLERNDGTKERPYHMTKGLLKLLRRGKGKAYQTHGGSLTTHDLWELGLESSMSDGSELVLEQHLLRKLTLIEEMLEKSHAVSSVARIALPAKDTHVNPSNDEKPTNVLDNERFEDTDITTDSLNKIGEQTENDGDSVTYKKSMSGIISVASNIILPAKSVNSNVVVKKVESKVDAANDADTITKFPDVPLRREPSASLAQIFVARLPLPLGNQPLSDVASNDGLVND